MLSYLGALGLDGVEDDGGGGDLGFSSGPDHLINTVVIASEVSRVFTS